MGCNPDLYHCDCCERDLCGHCVGELDCVRCGKSNCVACAANGLGSTKRCGQCHQAYCEECDPDMDHLGENVCEGCGG